MKPKVGDLVKVLVKAFSESDWKVGDVGIIYLVTKPNKDRWKDGFPYMVLVNETRVRLGRSDFTLVLDSKL